MKSVDIPGVGTVDFPDEMSDKDISHTIDKEIMPQVAERKRIDDYWAGRDSQEDGGDGRPGILTQFGNDIGRGLSQMQQLGYGLGGLAADVVGADETSKAWLQRYQDIGQDIQQNNPPTIGSYKNIHGFEDALRYGVEAIGENALMAVPSLLTGGAGAVVGRGIAEKGVAGFVESQVAKGVAREVAEKQAASYLTKATTAGGVAGAYPPAAGMEMGSIYGDVYEQTGVQAPGTAATLGAIAGALDVVGEGLALRRVFGRELSETAARSLVSRLGIAGAEQFVTEAPTEALQTVLERTGVALQDPSREVFSKQGVEDIANAFLKGGIGGAGVGVVAESTGSIMDWAKRRGVEPTQENLQTAAAAGDTQAIEILKASGVMSDEQLANLSPEAAERFAARYQSKIAAEQDPVLAAQRTQAAVENRDLEGGDPLSEVMRQRADRRADYGGPKRADILKAYETATSQVDAAIEAGAIKPNERDLAISERVVGLVPEIDKRQEVHPDELTMMRARVDEIRRTPPEAHTPELADEFIRLKTTLARAKPSRVIALGQRHPDVAGTPYTGVDGKPATGYTDDPGLRRAVETAAVLNQPKRIGRGPGISDAEVAYAQAVARRTQEEAARNQAPGTAYGSEDRLPQTRDDIAEQRQAEEAFRLVAGKPAAGEYPGGGYRARLDESAAKEETNRDPRLGGRPQGGAESQKPVILDQGYPVKVTGDRFAKNAQGDTIRVATVHRYDPRTGDATGPFDPETNEPIGYEVQADSLTVSKYAQEPRRAQEFEKDARTAKVAPYVVEPHRDAAGKIVESDAVGRTVTPEAAATKKRPGVRLDELQGLPRQTYRETPPDPTIPGAEGPTSELPDGGPVPRSPRPEQGEGPSFDLGSGRRGANARGGTTGEEWVQREAKRRERMKEQAERGETHDEQGQPNDWGKAKSKYEGQKTGYSGKPKGLDEDGWPHVDEDGYILSDKGGPIRFETQEAMKKRLIELRKAHPDAGIVNVPHPGPMRKTGAGSAESYWTLQATRPKPPKASPNQEQAAPEQEQEQASPEQEPALQALSGPQHHFTDEQMVQREADEQGAVPRIRQHIADGKPLSWFDDGHGTVRAGYGLGEDTLITLNLAPAERKALTRANADLDLADTPEERTAAKKAIQDVLRPATERAIAERQAPLTAPEASRNDTVSTPEQRSSDTETTPVRNPEQFVASVEKGLRDRQVKPNPKAIARHYEIDERQAANVLATIAGRGNKVIRQVKPSKKELAAALKPKEGAEAPAPKGPRYRLTPQFDEDMSLLEFLMSKGGLAANGDLTAMDAHKKSHPRYGNLVRKQGGGGLSLDEARELAEGEGYIGQGTDDYNTTTERDLLEAIEEELRGSRVTTDRSAFEPEGNFYERWAAELGIEVNPDWSEVELMAEIGESAATANVEEPDVETSDAILDLVDSMLGEMGIFPNTYSADFDIPFGDQSARSDQGAREVGTASQGAAETAVDGAGRQAPDVRSGGRDPAPGTGSAQEAGQRSVGQGRSEGGRQTPKVAPSGQIDLEEAIETDRQRRADRIQPIDPAAVPDPVNEKPIPTDAWPDERLLVISCGSDKSDAPGTIPAIERYTGPRYNELRKWMAANPGQEPQIVILSGKFGFIAGRRLIPNYNQPMTSNRADKLVRDGAAENGAMDAAHRYRDGYRDVFIIGGGEYTRPINAAVTQLVQAGVIHPDAAINRSTGNPGVQKKQMMDWVGKTQAPEERAKATPEPDPDKRLEQLKDQVQVFASGMSAPQELSAGLDAWSGMQTRGIGVEIGRLSNPGIETLAKAVVDKNAAVFVDSGAYGLGMAEMRGAGGLNDLLGELGPVKPKPLDFDEVLAKYDRIIERIAELNGEHSRDMDADSDLSVQEAYRLHEDDRMGRGAEEDRQLPLFVMPDIVMDQRGSLDLAKRYREHIRKHTDLGVSRPIVPIQKGELSLAEAYRELVATLGTDQFVVGIPAATKAVTDQELRAFLDEVKPARIHILGGASPATLDPKLRIIAEAGLDPEHISADANILRAALWGQQEAGVDRKTAVRDKLVEKGGKEFSEQVNGPETNAPAKGTHRRVNGVDVVATGHPDWAWAGAKYIEATGVWQPDSITGRATPEEAAKAVQDKRRRDDAEREERREFNEFYEDQVNQAKSGRTLTPANIKNLTKFGDGKVTTGNAKGFLRDMGLSAKQADDAVARVGSADQTSGGAWLYDLKRIIQAGQNVLGVGEGVRTIEVNGNRYGINEHNQVRYTPDSQWQPNVLSNIPGSNYLTVNETARDGAYNFLMKGVAKNWRKLIGVTFNEGTWTARFDGAPDRTGSYTAGDPKSIAEVLDKMAYYARARPEAKKTEAAAPSGPDMFVAKDPNPSLRKNLNYYLDDLKLTTSSYSYDLKRNAEHQKIFRKEVEKAVRYYNEAVETYGPAGYEVERQRLEEYMFTGRKKGGDIEGLKLATKALSKLSAEKTAAPKAATPKPRSSTARSEKKPPKRKERAQLLSRLFGRDPSDQAKLGREIELTAEEEAADDAAWKERLEQIAPRAETVADIRRILDENVARGILDKATAKGISDILARIPTEGLKGVRLVIQDRMTAEEREILGTRKGALGEYITLDDDPDTRVLVVQARQGARTAVDTFVHENAHVLFDRISDADKAAARRIYDSSPISRQALHTVDYGKDERFEEWFAESMVDYYNDGLATGGPRGSLSHQLGGLANRLYKRIVDLFSNEKAQIDAFFSGLERSLGYSSDQAELGRGPVSVEGITRRERRGVSTIAILSNPIGAITGDWKAWRSGYQELARDVTEAWKDRGTRPNRQSAAGALARSFFYSADGEFRAGVGKFNSPTLNMMADIFHPRAGATQGLDRKLATKLGMKISSNATFDEAVTRKVNTDLRQLDRILKGFREDPAALDRIVDLVQRPSARRSDPESNAAGEIARMLKGLHTYMKEAGVNVGEIKVGYFPREIDVGAVMKDHPAFVTAATKAYRAAGLGAKEAAEAADNWLTNILYGGSGSPARKSGGGSPSFVQNRVLTKQADEILKDFYQRDPDAILGSYITRAVKRAEIARRFGDNWKNWENIEKQIRSEDPAAAGMFDHFRSYAATVTGTQHHNVPNIIRQGSSLVRTFATLSLLEKSTFSSLAEAITPALRSGSAVDFFPAITRTLNELRRELKDMPPSVAAELAADIGAVAGSGVNSIMAARFAGGDPLGRAQARVLSTYFRRIGLEQWTDATRVASTERGAVFIRRLARDIAGKGLNPKSARIYMAELGIPTDQLDAFVTYVNGFGDNLPSPDDLNKGGEMGTAYRTALLRFVDQTIMRPNAATRPRWASHPLGAIAFQLQAFTYSFSKNVLLRDLRLAKTALTEKDMGLVDRALLLAPLAMLPVLAMCQYLVGDLRDWLFMDPERRKAQTTAATVEKAISRAGLTGALDPYLQMVTGARYQKDPISTFTGPFLGVFGAGLGAAEQMIANNSPNTNAAERKASEALYDVILEPMTNLLLGFAPVSPLTGLITSGFLPMMRDDFVDSVAGPRIGHKQQPVFGLSELLMGKQFKDKSGSWAARG